MLETWIALWAQEMTSAERAAVAASDEDESAAQLLLLIRTMNYLQAAVGGMGRGSREGTSVVKFSF